MNVPEQLKSPRRPGLSNPSNKQQIAVSLTRGVITCADHHSQMLTQNFGTVSGRIYPCRLLVWNINYECGSAWTEWTKWPLLSAFFSPFSFLWLFACILINSLKPLLQWHFVVYRKESVYVILLRLEEYLLVFMGADWKVCVHMCGHTGARTPIRPAYTVQDTYLRV